MSTLFKGPGSRVGVKVRVDAFGTKEQSVARIDLAGIPGVVDAVRNNAIATILQTGGNDTTVGGLVRIYAIDTQINVRAEIGRGRVYGAQGVVPNGLCARHAAAFVADSLEMTVQARVAHNPANPIAPVWMTLECWGSETSSATRPPWYLATGSGRSGTIDPLSTDLYEFDFTNTDVNDAYVLFTDGSPPTAPGVYTSNYTPLAISAGKTASYVPVNPHRFPTGVGYVVSATPFNFTIPAAGSSIIYQAQIA